jgi:SAM-dependent methyltransferase
MRKDIYLWMADYYRDPVVYKDCGDVRQRISTAVGSAAIDSVVTAWLDDLTVAGDRVVCLGAGTGERERAISDRLSHPVRLLLMEPDESMRGTAGDGQEVLGGRAEDFDGRGDPADAVVFLGGFLVLPDREARRSALSNIREGLRPGASLIFDVWSLTDVTGFGPELRRRYAALRLESRGYEEGDGFVRRVRGSAIHFIHLFTEEEIRQMLEEAGFTVEATHYVAINGPASGRLVASADAGSLVISARTPK